MYVRLKIGLDGQRAGSLIAGVRIQAHNFPTDAASTHVLHELFQRILRHVTRSHGHAVRRQRASRRGSALSP